VFKRYDSTIRKLLLKGKKTIKVTPSSITRIGLIIYIEDPEEAPGVDYIHIEDTKVKETTVANITTTTHPVRSNAISIINLNTSQVSI
jgi:Fe-S cluster assembly ATPase SufC